MIQANDLAQQFAQALANGDMTITDVGYVLEHIDGFLKDYEPDVYKWMPRTIDSVAEELYEAERLAQNEE